MTIRLTAVITLLFISLLACKPAAQSETADTTAQDTTQQATDNPADVTYKILNETPDGNNLHIDVELSNTTDTARLQAIAAELRSTRTNAEKLDINFMLPWGNVGFPFATASYNPNLVISIKPVDDIRSAIAGIKGKVLQVWQTGSVLGATFVLYEDAGGNKRMRTLFEDGNTMDNPITASKHDGKVRYDDDMGKGEFYLVEANGNLGLYDANEKFDEAKLVQ